MGLDEANEPHPLESYDLGCDEGAWNHVLRKMWCIAQALPFAIGKWSIGIGVDLMAWALEFQIATALTPVAGPLSRLYDSSLIGPLGVRHLAWVLALFVAGWHLMRARAAQGASQLAATFLIAAIGTIVLANPQGYLEGSIALAQNSSGAVLEATDDTLRDGDSDAAPGPDEVSDRIGDVLRRSFIAEPYDLLNWGEQLSGDCAAARDEVLEGGPWGSDDEPRDIMRDHGCNEQADFNHDPTDSRAAGSLIVMLASVAATVLLVAIALVVFVAQLTLIACFAGASIVWVLALFPAFREVLWWWLGRLAWAVAATVAATFVLTWLAITITAALAATADISIIQRCLVVLLIVAFGFRLRSGIGRGVDALIRRISNRLGQATGQPGRLSGAAVGAGAGAVAGFGLSATARSWAFDTPGGQYAYNRLYSRHFTRGYRSRGGTLAGVRRAVRRAGEVDQKLTGAGRNAARRVGRGVRAIALAPVLGPRAVVAGQTRATAASRRARTRLAQARATRRQWVRNAAHPVDAVRAARQQAAQRPRTTPSPPTTRSTRGERQPGPQEVPDDVWEWM
jgi:hypothetical protein